MWQRHLIWAGFLIGLIPTFVVCEEQNRGQTMAAVIFGREFRDQMVSLVLHEAQQDLILKLQEQMQGFSGKTIGFQTPFPSMLPFAELLEAKEEELFQTLTKLRNTKIKSLTTEYEILETQYQNVIARLEAIEPSHAPDPMKKFLQERLIDLELKRRENRLEYRQAESLLERWRSQFQRLKNLELNLTAVLEITPVLERGDLTFSQDHEGRSLHHLVNADLGLDIQVAVTLKDVDAYFEEILPNGTEVVTPIDLSSPPEQEVNLMVLREGQPIQPRLGFRTSVHEDLNNPQMPLQVAIEEITINEEEDQLAFPQESLDRLIDWMFSKENIESTVGALYKTKIMQDLVTSVGQEAVSSLKRRRFPLLFWMYIDEKGEFVSGFGFRTPEALTQVAALKKSGQLVTSAEGDMPLFIEDFSLRYDVKTQIMGIDITPPEMVQVDFHPTYIQLNQEILNTIKNEDVRHVLEALRGVDISDPHSILKTQVRLPKNQQAHIDLPLLFANDGVQIDSTNFSVDFKLLEKAHFSSFEWTFGHGLSSVFFDPKNKEKSLLDQAMPGFPNVLTSLRAHQKSSEAIRKAESRLENLVISKVKDAVLHLGKGSNNGLSVKNQNQSFDLKITKFDFLEKALQCDYFETNKERMVCRLTLPQEIEVQLRNIVTEEGNKVDEIISHFKSEEPQVLTLEFYQDPENGKLVLDEEKVRVLEIFDQYKVAEVEVGGEVFGADFKGLGAHFSQILARRVAFKGHQRAANSQNRGEGLSFSELLALGGSVAANRVDHGIQRLEKAEAEKKFREIMDLQRLKLAQVFRKELIKNVDHQLNKQDQEFRKIVSEFVLNRLPLEANFGAFRLHGANETLKEKADRAATNILRQTMEGLEGGLSHEVWPEMFTNEQLVHLFKNTLPEEISDTIQQSFADSKESYIRFLRDYLEFPTLFVDEEMQNKANVEGFADVISRDLSGRLITTLQNPHVLKETPVEGSVSQVFRVPEVQGICVHHSVQFADDLESIFYTALIKKPLRGRAETQDQDHYEVIGGLGAENSFLPDLNSLPLEQMQQNKSAAALLPFSEVSELMWINAFFIQEKIRQSLLFDEEGKRRAGIQEDIDLRFKPGDWQTQQMFRMNQEGQMVARFALHFSQNDQTITQDHMDIPVIKEVLGGLVDLAGRPLLRLDTKGNVYMDVPLDIKVEDIIQNQRIVGYRLSLEAAGFKFVGSDQARHNLGTSTALNKIRDTIYPRAVSNQEAFSFSYDILSPIGFDDLEKGAHLGINQVSLIRDSQGRLAVMLEIAPNQVDASYREVPRSIPFDIPQRLVGGQTQAETQTSP